MAQDPRPYSGFSQPEIGNAEPVAFWARNVVLLRDREWKHLRTETDRNEQLAKAIDTTLSQVQRICKGKLGTSIDTVEWLAEALHVRPHDLLTPYFANTQAAPTEGNPSGERALQPR